ncbi:MAG: glycosyltransferase family 2 protein [Pseudomonadota bacterium]
MIPNTLLSITIPTYNRADFLDYSLEIHIPLARAYNVQIYISDNASTDSTKEVVEKWQQEYSLIHYFCNERNIGEINFEIALKLPQTEYVWLLGDTYQIPSNGIQYLLTVISKEDQNYDAFIFNLANRITDIIQQDYQDHNALLHDIGALMTCLSCLVYHKSLINNGSFRRYYDTYFIQTGVILEDIAYRPFCIQWVQTLSVQSLIHPSLQKINWSLTSKAFEIGCEKWTNFIFSLPPTYSIENKMKCIMDFGEVSTLFTIKSLILLRLHEILTYTTFKKYRYLFKLTIDIPIVFIFILSITPKLFLQIAGIMIITFFGNNKRKKIKLLIAKGANS